MTNSKSRILVIPSWYATVEKPNTGSFFREQSLLMTDKYDVSVMCFEKNWISWKRYLFENVKKKVNCKLKPIEVSPPKGHVLAYDHVGILSENLNHQLMLQDIVSGFQYYIEKHGKPDLIHAHCAFMGGIIASHLSDFFGIPYIITEHYNPFIINEFPLFYHPKIKRALEEANQVLAVSHHQKQNILMNRINCNPIVVGNLVDDERFTIAEKSESNDDVVELLIVTFYPNFIKDMETFFSALELLRENNFSFNATIIGGKSGGELNDNYYLEQIKKSQLHNNCTIVEEASRQEMVGYMQNTDIFISTSIAESFGVAICEAMLCGKPVVCTRNGGVNDYVNDRNGVLVNLKDAELLAEALINMVKNIESYSPEEIRNSIMKKYGKKSFFHRIDSIYQKVLND